tara:strand:- start:438 stop:3170 length:2733 start_codon:yes stop_codon:yes gene_type:complete
MELALLGGLMYLGNKINFKQEDSDEISDHKVKLMYNNSEEEIIKKKEEDLSKLVERSKDPIKNNIINNSINSVNNISLNYKDMNSKFYESNKKMLKDSEKLESFNNNLSYENQFRPLTFDNDSNPLPSSFNKSNNSIEKDLAIGNGYSYLNDNMNYGVTDENDLDHNNMVPHFSKKQIINDYNEQTFAHRMELFSGSSKNFTPKKELLKENFAPLEKDVNLVNGSQSNIELLQGYYLPSTQKRNVLPFEQQQVGPGLNLDPSQTSRPDGGSFEEYRPMPKTVDELRSYDNPKITFEGVMKSGQKGSKSSTIGKVYKRGPEKTRELKVDDLQKMGGEYKKEKSRDNIILKDTGRTTSQMVIGSAKYQNDSVSKKNNSEVRESKKKENTIIDFSNFKSIIDKVKSNLDSYMLTKNQRYDTSTLNLNPPNKYSLGVVKFDPHDLAKKTIKETTSINQQSGHARNDIDSVKTYDPNDILKTTKKQTTSFNEQTGYAKSEINNTQFYDPNDIPNRTQREDLLFNQNYLNAKSEINNTQFYNPNDIPNRTQREDLLFNQNSLNAKSEINNTQFYNPNDIPNRTHREDTIFNENLLNNRADVNRSLVYNPNDLPNRTQKEDLVFTKDILNSRGDVNRTSVYDPNNLPNRTQKEDLVFTKDILNSRGDVNRSTSYNPNELAKNTIKQIDVINKRSGNVGGDLKNKSFDPNNIPAKTLKELIVNEYEYGIAHGLINKGVSFNPYDIPAETLKEMIVYNDFIQGATMPFNEGGGYLTSKVQIPETLRQLVSILRFSGALGHQAPKDYTAEKNMIIDEKKEKTIHSRYPTNRKHDEAPTKSNIGNINLKSNNNIERNQIMDRNNYYNNNYQIPTNYILKQNNDKDDRLNPNILNQLNDNPLVNNLVFQNHDDIDLDEILCD